MKRVKNNKIIKVLAVATLSCSLVFGGVTTIKLTAKNADTKNIQVAQSLSSMANSLETSPLSTGAILPLLPATTTIGIRVQSELTADRVKLAPALDWYKENNHASFPDFPEASPLTIDNIAQLHTLSWPYGVATLNAAIDYMGTSASDPDVHNNPPGHAINNSVRVTTIRGFYRKYNFENGPFETARQVLNSAEAIIYEQALDVYSKNQTDDLALQGLNTAIINLNNYISDKGFSYAECKNIARQYDEVTPVYHRYNTFIAKGNARLALVKAEIQTKYQFYLVSQNMPYQYVGEVDFYKNGVLDHNKADLEAMINADDAWRLSYAHFDDSGNVITDANVKNKRSFIDTESEDRTTEGFPVDKPHGSDLSQYSQLNDVIKICSVRYAGLTEFYERKSEFIALVNGLKPITELKVSDKAAVNAAYNTINSFNSVYGGYIYGETRERENLIQDLLTAIERRQNKIYQLEKGDTDSNNAFLIIILCTLGLAMLGGGAYMYVALKGKEKTKLTLGNIRQSEINGSDVVMEQVLITKKEITEAKKDKINAHIDFDD